MAQKVMLEDGSLMGYLAANTGTIHQTEAEAVADENEAKYAARVEAFVTSKTWKRGQDTRAFSLIKEYLAWCDTKTGQDLLAQAEAAAIAAAAAPADDEEPAEAAAAVAPAVPPVPPAPVAATA